MSGLTLAVLIALAAVAVLAGLRLFLVAPRERRPELRSNAAGPARAALRDLWNDPDSVDGRQAEAQGDWSAARAAYGRALERLELESPDDPQVALKRRALESKLEELRRLEESKELGS